MKVFRVASLAIMAAVPASAQDGALEPKEWTVPWERTRPRDPVMDQAGRVWFVGQTGNYVAYLEPKSGEFKRFQITDGTNPHNIVVDERGGIWFTGNRNGRIVQLDPKSGELKNYMMPDSTLRDPHTMIFGKDGVAWFTAQRANKIGRLDRATGEIRVWTASADRSNPYGVVVDSRNQPWFDLFGTNKIATIDPKTLQYREYTLPNERARPRRIAVTSDDAVWYGDYSQGKLGRLDPKTGAVEEYALPSGPSSLPYAMTVDDRDRLWLVETGVQPNRMVAFDPKSKSWVANFAIPSNGATRNTVRHMTFNRATREIWFGTDAGTIGHVNVSRELRALTP
jgi:virginiamycin B lyase